MWAKPVVTRVLNMACNSWKGDYMKTVKAMFSTVRT